MKQFCFRLDETDPSPVKDVNKCVKPEESTRDATSDTTEPVTPKETFQEPPKKRQKSEGNSSRASLRKLELKDRKAEMDKIVSPVIPQPGAWGERHRFKPPPQRETQINVDQAVPQFKETNARFQYGNYNRLVASVLTRLKIINQFSLFYLKVDSSLYLTLNSMNCFLLFLVLKFRAYRYIHLGLKTTRQITMLN